MLELLSSVDSGESSVECAEWEMTGFPGELQDEAIGETERGSGAEEIESLSDRVGVLEAEALVIQQHCNDGCEFLSAVFVYVG